MHYVIDAFYPNPKGSGRRLRIAKEKEACSCQSEKSPLEGKEQRAETQYAKFWPASFCNGSAARIWRIASLLQTLFLVFLVFD
jgi:hypothetical protein